MSLDVAILLVVLLLVIAVPAALLSFVSVRLRIGLCVFVMLVGAALSYNAYVAKVHGPGLLFFFVSCCIVATTFILATSRRLIEKGRGR